MEMVTDGNCTYTNEQGYKKLVMEDISKKVNYLRLVH